MAALAERRTPYLGDALDTPNEAIIPEATSRARLFFVDHVRVLLTILWLRDHLAITYGALAPWYYQEGPADGFTSIALTIFILFNQAFFMGAFFLIAGHFTPGSYDRKGGRAFLKDRLQRLGLPFLAYDLLLGPLASLGYYFGTYRHQADAAPYWQYYLATTGAGVAWFIETLLLFALGYAAWRRFTRGQQDHATHDSPPPTYRAIVTFTLILAVASALVRFVFPVGWFAPWFNLQFGYFPQYIALFVIGVVSYRRGWFLTIPRTMGKVGFGAALAARILLLPPAMLSDGAFTSGVHWQTALYALWDSIVVVGMSLGLLTLFRARFNAQGQLGRFLSAHAYTVYLIHAPLIVGLAYALSGLHLYLLLKFALAVLVGVPLCFLAAALVRKLPLARQVL